MMHGQKNIKLRLSMLAFAQTLQQFTKNSPGCDSDKLADIFHSFICPLVGNPGILDRLGKPHPYGF